MKTNTETTAPVLPAHLKIEILSRRVEENNHHFTVRLKNEKTGEAMKFPYSGGCLAFEPDLSLVYDSFENRDGEQVRTGIKRGMEKIPALLKDWRKDVQVKARTQFAEDRRVAVMEAVNKTANVKTADVLYSLLSDMDAGAESFKDFCDNYGYDTDSRKAWKTWEDCKHISQEFQRVAGSDIKAIREALADY